MRTLLAVFLGLALCAKTAWAQDADSDPLPTLIEVLGQTDDAQFQLDILKGVSQALKGRRSVPMPKGWEQVETKLGSSPNSEVKALAQSLALTFGSARALQDLRKSLQDPQAEIGVRRSALEALLAAKDSQLAPILQKLISDPQLRGGVLRGLALYDHPQTPGAILPVYKNLSGAEKRDALNTLSARAPYAKALLAAVEKGEISSKDLTADLVRQLRNLKNPELDGQIQKVWGAVRDTTADKQQEIDKYLKIYRAGGSQPGDASRGRAVFARTCQQCHTLFDVGGKVGPDLTGSNRADIGYILQNMVDPNAVIPNDYRSSTLDTKDDRSITGIVRQQDEKSVTIVTANEVLVIPANEIKSLRQNELSMMPEGLLSQLSDQEVRDLIYYLSRPGQVPLLATPETVAVFFNGKDLGGWDGDAALWKVENGEIVGRSAAGLKRNEFLKGQMIFGDFRLVCKVKLVPNRENSGIQFRSQPLPDGEVKGYQADVGLGWWGKLYEEQGRAILWDKSGDALVKQEQWNTYEIVAVGHKIRTAINGKICVDLDDAAGALQGVFAFQLHAGGPLEVRYRDFDIELNPKFELKTAL